MGEPPIDIDCMSQQLDSLSSTMSSILLFCQSCITRVRKHQNRSFSCISDDDNDNDEMTINQTSALCLIYNNVYLCTFYLLSLCSSALYLLSSRLQRSKYCGEVPATKLAALHKVRMILMKESATKVFAAKI